MTFVNRLFLTCFVWLIACGPSVAQTTAQAAGTDPALPAAYPSVTFGVQSFVEYAASLHEQQGFNAFNVTRGYLNIRARLSDRVQFRFTPDVRPTTDANLDRNLALRLEFATLDVVVKDGVEVMFGLHETPWLTFEQSVNRYRVLGPFFAERLGLIPGPTDLGASVRAGNGRTEVHFGCTTARVTGAPSATSTEHRRARDVPPLRSRQPARKRDHLRVLPVRLVRQRPSAQRGHRDGYLQEHQPPGHGAVSVGHRQPVRGRGHPAARPVLLRRGPPGSDGVGGRAASFHRRGRRQRQRLAATSDRRWRPLEPDGTGRLGVVVTLEQTVQSANSQLLGRRLLAQTHIEF